MGKSHASNIVDMDFFDEIKAFELWEEGLLVLFVNKHSHLSRVDDVSFKLFLVIEWIHFDDLFHFLLQLPGYVVLFANFDVKDQLFFVLGARN